MFKKELDKLIHQCKEVGCFQSRSKGLNNNAKRIKEIEEQRDKVIGLYEEK